MRWTLVAGAAAALLCCVHAVDVQEVIRSVPQEDRLRFIQRHAMIGYGLAHGEAVELYEEEARFADLNDVSEFCISLYEWLLKRCIVRHLTERSLDGPNIICFPNRKCVDVGDVGVHP